MATGADDAPTLPMVASGHMPEIHIPKLENAHKAEATYYGDAVFIEPKRLAAYDDLTQQTDRALRE